MKMASPVKIWRNQKRIRELLRKRGEIVSWTRVFVPPEGFVSHAPYVVALVLLDDGGKITAQLSDYDEKHLKIGQRVCTVLRRTKDPGDEGIIPYGVKFKPIEK